MLIMLGEDGDSKFDTNVNFFLEEFGISVNNGITNPNPPMTPALLSYQPTLPKSTLMHI